MLPLLLGFEGTSHPSSILNFIITLSAPFSLLNYNKDKFADFFIDFEKSKFFK